MDAHELIEIEPNPEVEEFGPGDTVRVDVQNGEIVLNNVSEPALT